MKKEKSLLIAGWINVIIFVLEVYASIMRAFNAGLLFENMDSKIDFEMFYWFTINSNILMGICSIVMAIACFKYKSKGEVPKGIMVFKLCGTSALLLVFVIVMVYLWPIVNMPGVFEKANVFYHVLCPILGVVALWFESATRISFKYVFVLIIPMAVYATVYTVCYVCQIGLFATDLYSFFAGNNVYFVPAVVIISSILSGLLCIKTHNIRFGKKEKQLQSVA